MMLQGSRNRHGICSWNLPCLTGTVFSCGECRSSAGSGIDVYSSYVLI